MASSWRQTVYRRTEDSDVIKSRSTTTSVLKDHARRDSMPSSRQAESDEVTKSCANVTTRLGDMTLQDDKLPGSMRAFNSPSYKATDIVKLETESLETTGEICLKTDDELKLLNTSSLCEMNTQGTANSASCSQRQQFQGSYQYSPLKVNSPLNTERSNVTSKKTAGSEYHYGHEHSVIAASGLPSRIDLHSDPMPSTSSVTNQLSRRLQYGSGHAQTGDTKYVVAGERARGVHYDVITSQKKPKSLAVNYRLPMEKPGTEITAVEKSKMAQYKQMQPHKDGLQLHCKGCDSMSVRYSDLRTIRQMHHVVLDPEFKGRIKTETHQYPNKFDGIEKRDKIYCKRCGGDWGISGLYRRIQIYVLKVSGFTIIDQDHNKRSYSKWKEVPFPLNELRKEDMQLLRQAGCSSSSPRGHYNFEDDSHF